MSNFPATYHGKPLLSPARKPLLLPNAALAQAIMAEWAALGEEKPDPQKLPLTGFAALTLDIITPQRAAIIEELLEYGETDLLFYREENAEALQIQQAKEWQPWVQWAEQRLGTHYHIAGGIIPVAQPAENAAKHLAAIEALTDWQLACLAVVVKGTTSLILGLAFMEGHLNAANLFPLAWLEESHNLSQWGEDAEIAAKAAKLRVELEAAEHWLRLL